MGEIEAKGKSSWKVRLSNRASKDKDKLPDLVQDAILFLIKEMEALGPLRSNWPHFGPLHKGRGIPENSYHCHLKRGKPTYVACWIILSKKDRTIEVFYVGTHEKSPY